mgnify:CR=1 FL=1
MNRTKLMTGALIWVASLIGVAVWASPGEQAPGKHIMIGEPYGEIISGADLGFQRVAAPDGKVTGRLMVRIDGEWREATFAMRLVK